jgi:hypothetical protein
MLIKSEIKKRLGNLYLGSLDSKKNIQGVYCLSKLYKFTNRYVVLTRFSTLCQGKK